MFVRNRDVRLVARRGLLGRLVAAAALLLLATTPLVAQSQSGRVAGLITDSASAQPLASVQVTLSSGTTRLLARTTAEGRYTIANVPAGTYGLEALRLGFRRVVRGNLVVTAGATLTYNVRMEPAALSLQAVVTTGLVDPSSGTRVPFTVGRVSAEDLPVPATNALESIQGKIAGVSAVPQGQAGSGTDIILRTPTSISKNNSPLIVVDGVIQTDAFGASSADLQSMDIESVEVVKGAAGASLYGARAASGVINIRTKRGGGGGSDASTRFTVRSEYGSNSIDNRVRWAGSHFYLVNDRGEWLNAAGAVVPREQRVPEPAFTRFQDNVYAPGTAFNQVERFFDPGNFARNSLNLSQNTGKTNWFFSYVNAREDGVVLNSGRYNQDDFRLNLDHRPRSNLSIGVSAYHMRSSRLNVYDDTFFDLINQAPDVDLRLPDPDGTPYIYQPDFEGREENPLYVLATEENTRKRTRTQGALEMKFAPFSWLTFDGNLSYDRSDRATDFFLDQGVKTEGFANGGPGSISRFSGLTDALNASASVNLLRQVGAFTLRSTFRGLLERETNELTTASGNQFSTPGVRSLNNTFNRFVSSTSETIRTNSYFISGAVDYRGKLLFDALLRQDGSSLFGPEEQENWYYRYSGAYRPSAEKWWPVKAITEFKLRASIGTAGGRPSFNDQYETYNFVEGGGLVKQNLGNRFLKPERSRETEFGFDAIVKDRYSIQVSRARQTTSDQLILVPLAGFFGYSSQWQNAGTVEGNTWEGTFEAQIIRRPNFTWRAGVVADRSRNQITEFNRSCFTVNTIAFRCAGETLSAMYGFSFMKNDGQLAPDARSRASEFGVNDDGLLVWVGQGNTFREGESKRLWGTSSTIGTTTYGWGLPITAVDSNGNAAVRKIGDGTPKFRFGVTNTIGWGGVQVFMLWDTQVGGNVYNRTNQRMYQFGRSSDVDQDLKIQEFKKPVDYYTSLYAANSPADFFVEDGGYVKLRELSIKYRLPARFTPTLARVGAQSASISLIGRNMLTFTNYKGYDPEVGTVLNRFDSFVYPRYRTVTGSVEITF